MVTRLLTTRCYCSLLATIHSRSEYIHLPPHPTFATAIEQRLTASICDSCAKCQPLQICLVLSPRRRELLEKPSDWSNWLILRRNKASQNNIWEYCNPDEPKTELGPEPRRPRVSDYNPNATKLSDLTGGQQNDYRDALETFAFEYPRWKKKDRHLRAMASEILATMATRHLYLLKDQTIAYNRLKVLKQHLCPSDRTRERELQVRFRDLLKSPRGRGIDKWLEEWITVTDESTRQVVHEARRWRIVVNSSRPHRQLQELSP